MAAAYRRALKHVPEPDRAERWAGLVAGAGGCNASGPHQRAVCPSGRCRRGGHGGSQLAHPADCRPRGRRQVPVPGSEPKHGHSVKLVPAERRAAQQQCAPEPDIPRLARTNQQRGTVSPGRWPSSALLRGVLSSGAFRQLHSAPTAWCAAGAFLGGRHGAQGQGVAPGLQGHRPGGRPVAQEGQARARGQAGVLQVCTRPTLAARLLAAHLGAGLLLFAASCWRWRLASCTCTWSAFCQHRRRLQDPPTFVRFVKSLGPKPSVPPEQRRAAAEQRQQLAELRAEVKLVQALPGAGDP
jgi:hypothetical protein